MATNVNFYCRKSKSNRKGLSPIEMSIIINGKRMILSTGMSYSSSTFEKDSRKGELQAYLSGVERTIYQYVMELSTKGDLSLESLKKAYLRGSTVDVYTVKDMVDDYLKHIDGVIADSNYKSYVLASQILFECIKADDSIYKIDVGTVEKFQKIQRLRNYSANYQNLNLSRFKTMFNYAVNNGKVTMRNPFRMAKKAKTNDVIPIMSDDDYLKLVNGKCSNPTLEKVRKYFVLACNCGLAHCDLERVNSDNIKIINGQTVIFGRRLKTDVQFTAVVLSDGVKVLEGIGYNVKSICYSNQYLNSSAKKMAKELGIECNLHTHLCRHQYITKLIRSGVNLCMVKRCVGHSNISMTERYLSLSVDDVVEAVSHAI